MPVYVYKCRACKQTFEKRHGMFFEQDHCVLCLSRDIFKIPSLQSVKRGESNKKETGKLVKQYIEDTKKEVKEERRKLASEEM